MINTIRTPALLLTIPVLWVLARMLPTRIPQAAAVHPRLGDVVMGAIPLLIALQGLVAWYLALRLFRSPRQAWMIPAALAVSLGPALLDAAVTWHHTPDLMREGNPVVRAWLANGGTAQSGWAYLLLVMGAATVAEATGMAAAWAWVLNTPIPGRVLDGVKTLNRRQTVADEEVYWVLFWTFVMVTAIRSALFHLWCVAVWLGPARETALALASRWGPYRAENAVLYLLALGLSTGLLMTTLGVRARRNATA